MSNIHDFKSVKLVYMTLNQWNKIGFKVIKGEKSHKRLAGQALFSKEQVTCIYSTGSNSGHNDGYEYEGSWEETIQDSEFYH